MTWRSFPDVSFSTKVNLVVPEEARGSEIHDGFRDELELLDRLISGFRSDSEVTRLNRANKGRPQRVSSELFALLEVGCEACRLTQGRTDITVGSATASLHLPDRTSGQARSETRRLWTRKRVGKCTGSVVLDPTKKTVCYPRGVELDLHSVGKAYWADRVAKRLSERYSTPVLVDIGGDLAVSQPPSGTPIDFPIEVLGGWPSGSYREMIVIQEGGVATSGGYRPASLDSQDAVGTHHVIDPSTGSVVESPPATVTVMASKCWLANAFSTAIVASGPRAELYAATSTKAALVVRSDGLVTKTKAWLEVTNSGLGRTTTDQGLDGVWMDR